jgi:glycosyltransferase involved in cell wall biosynthesis
MTRADGWIAFGHTVHDTLKARELYARKPSCVLSPGVDIERFKPDASLRQRTLTKLGWTPADDVVGFLGRFVPQKGVSVLVRALRSTASRWRALFVGGGPMEQELRLFAAEYPGRVHVETAATHDDVPAWLNAMSVLCAPSQTTPRWREQFGRVLIEAMACGIPVIASTSGEMPLVVGAAGAIVPEDDARAWAAEIDRLLTEPAVRRERAAQGVERARSRFAWQTVAREHLDFFEALLDGPHR